jgi:hypothetical protein
MKPQDAGAGSVSRNIGIKDPSLESERTVALVPQVFEFNRIPPGKPYRLLALFGQPLPAPVLAPLKSVDPPANTDARFAAGVGIKLL